MLVDIETNIRLYLLYLVLAKVENNSFQHSYINLIYTVLIKLGFYKDLNKPVFNLKPLNSIIMTYYIIGNTKMSHLRLVLFQLFNSSLTFLILGMVKAKYLSASVQYVIHILL